jgi:DUF4097 and DUF4098 domain-containing protein YvlB
MSLMFRALAATAFLTIAALPAAAQQRQTDANFSWSGRISDGRWIRIRNLNGPITVGVASGNNVEVTATKQWHRGDPADVRFQTTKFGPNDESVLICALWGDNSSCDEHGYESHGDRRSRNNNNDVSVTFHVLVPKGVRVGVGTVNGAVRVDGATSDIDASTVNGKLEVETSGGHVNASNVNGGIRARLGRVDNDGNMEFTTVNGAVSLEVAGDFGADVDMSTVNGSLNTDFPMTLTGRMNPRSLHAHVGREGGPRIRLTTVNGSIELRKR